MRFASHVFFGGVGWGGGGAGGVSRVLLPCSLRAFIGGSRLVHTYSDKCLAVQRKTLNSL